MAVLALLGFVSIGLSSALADPTEFLKWSMDRYAQLKCWEVKGGRCWIHDGSVIAGSEQPQKIEFEAPGEFRLDIFDAGAARRLSVTAKGRNVCVISWKGDDSYDDQPPMPKSFTELFQALLGLTRSEKPEGDKETERTTFPDSLVDSGFEDLPSQVGPLPLFFGGRANFSKLVDTTAGSVRNCSSPLPLGRDEGGRWIEFQGNGSFGDIKLSIDAATGLVRQIAYDVAPGRYRNAPMSNKLVESLPAMEKTLRGASQLSGAQRAAIETLMSRAGKDMAAYVKTDWKSYTIVESLSLDSAKTGPVDEGDFSTAIPSGVTDVDAELSQSPYPVSGGNTQFGPTGQEAPEVTVYDAIGSPVKLSSLRGHVVMLDFWATWCGPCVEELPMLDKVATDLAKKGLRTLAVSSEDSKTTGYFAEMNRYTLPIYHDQAAAATKAFGVTGIPTTLVIDAKGIIRGHFIGKVSEDLLRKTIAEAGVK